MTNQEWPSIIFLQIEDYSGEDLGIGDGVTWCPDKINDSDVAYVRKAVVDELRAAAKLMAELLGKLKPNRFVDVLCPWCCAPITLCQLDLCDRLQALAAWKVANEK